MNNIPTAGIIIKPKTAMTGLDRKTLCIMLILSLAACSMGTLFFIFRLQIQNAVGHLSFYSQTHVCSGMIIYMLVYICFNILMMPATVMTLAGAYTFASIFGPYKGFIVCWLLVLCSATIGSVIAFCNGRYFLRNIIRRHLIHKVVLFNAIDNGVS